MTKTEDIWDRTLDSRRDNLARRIHAYIATGRVLDVGGLIAWYNQVSGSNSPFPSNVYATLGALERREDIEWTHDGLRRSGRIRRRSPCTVR